MSSVDQTICYKKLTSLTKTFTQFISDAKEYNDNNIVYIKNVYHLENDITLCIQTSKNFNKNKKIVELANKLSKLQLTEKPIINKVKQIQFDRKDENKVHSNPKRFALKNGRFYSPDTEEEPSFYREKQELNEKLIDVVRLLNERYDELSSFLSSDNKTLSDTLRIQRSVIFILNTSEDMPIKYISSFSITDKYNVLNNISSLHDKISKLYNDNIHIFSVSNDDPFAPQV